MDHVSLKANECGYKKEIEGSKNNLFINSISDEEMLIELIRECS